MGVAAQGHPHFPQRSEDKWGCVATGAPFFSPGVLSSPQPELPAFDIVMLLCYKSLSEIKAGKIR